MQKEILSQAATQARGLAIDAVHACSSGHLGLPLGCAEIGAVLYGGGGLRYNPAEPKWLNRDRFVLSGGHGSMFLYSWLHIAGYELSLEEVKNFRQLGSKTPGHPEFGDTVGVEATTGPLGQGIGNAVGYAVSGKRAAAKFNTADFEWDFRFAVSPAVSDTAAGLEITGDENDGDAILPVFGCIFFACAASWLWVDATRPIEPES